MFLRSQGFQNEVQMCHKSKKENTYHTCMQVVSHVVHLIQDLIVTSLPEQSLHDVRKTVIYVEYAG